MKKLKAEQSDTKGSCQCLNVKQVCERLGISESTVWRYAGLAEAGQSDFPRRRRIGRKLVRFLEADLQKYVEAQEHR